MNGNASAHYDEKSGKYTVADWVGRPLVSGLFEGHTAEDIAVAINRAYTEGIEAERRVMQSRVNRLLFGEGED